ncbi:MAG: hypothetical protein ACLUNS_00040 [Alistipes shahii]
MLFTRSLTICAVFFAGDFALVVEVGVEEKKLTAGLPVAELPPVAHTDAVGVPALGTGDVGSFREPERTAVEQLETLLLIEYRIVVAVGIGRVACDAGARMVVIGQHRDQVVERMSPGLLNADDIEILGIEHTGCHCFPVIPGDGVVESHVPRSQRKRLIAPLGFGRLLLRPRFGLVTGEGNAAPAAKQQGEREMSHVCHSV